MFELSWDPTRELQRWQREMDDLFSGVSGTVHAFPPLNVWAAENDAIVTAELPGLETEDIEITVHGDSLTLRGARKPVELKEGENYFRRERIYGDFARTLQLPFRVNADQVSAKVNHGVLMITLPRAEEDKPRKISVKAA